MSKDNTEISVISVLGIPLAISAYVIGVKELWGREAIVYIAKATLTIYALIVLLTLFMLAIVFTVKWWKKW